MDQKRVRILRVGIFVAIFAIVIRLFCIQILDHDAYVAKAAEEHVSEDVILAERGEIYMMDGQEAVPVVLNSTVFTVIFDPMVVNEEKTKEVLQKYAKDNLVENFEDGFKNKESRYFVAARNVNYTNAKKIEEAGLIGVSFEKRGKRVYVEGEMASQALGFVNSDGAGQYGVEGALNEKLSGTNGRLKSVRDVNGVALSIGEDNIKTPAVDGEDIVLSIDRNIQTKVEKILKEYLDKSAATNASAVVIDPQTGKVLAMANLPNYNPADFGNVKDAGAYQNNVLEGPYEAASVCKIFSFASAIDLGLMTPETTFVNTDSMTVDTLTFRNAYRGLLGTLTMQDAFNYSLNTGSATALKLMSGGGEINESGRQKLYDYYKKFRLGQYTGIELFEIPGLVPTPNEYDYTMNFTYANMTFGQGMNVTEMQIAAAVAGVVNGGYYHVPTIVEGKMVNGELVRDMSDRGGEQIVKVETSEMMKGMMYGQRSSRRTSGVDKPGYYIGGKTGTGQVVQADGSYSDASYEGEMIGSYVGFGGTEGEKPRYVAMVKAWGAGKYIDGLADAEPLFDQISNYLIDYLKIPPKV